MILLGATKTYLRYVIYELLIVQALEGLCILGLFVVIIFVLMGMLQDKALAALAIEDKKRQYAAAEKYLEDVLHSALASTD